MSSLHPKDTLLCRAIVAWLLVLLPLPLLATPQHATLHQAVRRQREITRFDSYDLYRGLMSYANRLGFRRSAATLEGETQPVDRRLREIQVMPAHRSAFQRLVMGLPASARWLDVGAGFAFAQRDYAAAGGRAQLVALGLRYPNTQATATALSAYKSKRGENVAASYSPETDKAFTDFEAAHRESFRYLHGRPIEAYGEQELLSRVGGKVDVLTDVMGAIAYSLHPDRVLARYSALLQKNGRMFLHFSQDAMTVRGAKGEQSVESWLRTIPGLKVARSYQIKQANGSALLTLVVRKVADEVSVPRLRLESFEPGTPPKDRLFRPAP